jgi:hypothetical protein
VFTARYALNLCNITQIRSAFKGLTCYSRITILHFALFCLTRIKTFGRTLTKRILTVQHWSYSGSQESVSPSRNVFLLAICSQVSSLFSSTLPDSCLPVCLCVYLSVTLIPTHMVNHDAYFILYRSMMFHFTYQCWNMLIHLTLCVRTGYHQKQLHVSLLQSYLRE